MNEDPHCPWKQCERCRRIFNMSTEGMSVRTWKYGDGLEGKPTNPKGPTFTKTYCLECVKEEGEGHKRNERRQCIGEKPTG